MKPILRDLAIVLLGIQNWIDFNPMEHPKILPKLFILDIVNGETSDDFRLKIRLTGTKIDTIFGKPTKGHFVDELVHGPRGEQAMQKFRDCALTGSAFWMQQVVCFPDKPAKYLEVVAIRIEPARIYGGIVAGGYTFSAESQFQWLPLQQAILQQDQKTA